MIYEAILFDMDGVVIDTHQSVTTFWERVAETHNVHLTPLDYEQHIYGCPANHTLDRLFAHLDADQRHMILTTMNEYEANLSYPAVPGVVGLLQRLQHHDIPTGLVTSGDRKKVEAVMRQLGLGHLFQAVVTADDIERGKPYPDCYQLAARQLAKPPERCLVFEDSLSGVKAAVAAGALCVGVQAPGGAAALRTVGAARVIPDFTATGLKASSNGATPGLTLAVDGEFRLALQPT